MNRFYRSREHKMIAGVAGGLAERFGVVPILVRLAFIVLTVFAILPGLGIYIVLWFVMPLTPERPGSMDDTSWH